MGNYPSSADKEHLEYMTRLKLEHERERDIHKEKMQGLY